MLHSTSIVSTKNEARITVDLACKEPRIILDRTDDSRVLGLLIDWELAYDLYEKLGNLLFEHFSTKTNKERTGTNVKRTKCI